MVPLYEKYSDARSPDLDRKHISIELNHFARGLLKERWVPSEQAAISICFNRAYIYNWQLGSPFDDSEIRALARSTVRSAFA